MNLDWFPFWLSLRVAALSTLLSTAAGLWLAYLLANRNFRGKETLDAGITLPLVLPPTVLGYYLLVVIGRESWFGRAWESVFGGPCLRRHRGCCHPPLGPALINHEPRKVRLRLSAPVPGGLDAAVWRVRRRKLHPRRRRACFRLIVGTSATIMVAEHPGRMQR
jgi:hypothetical protein